MAHTFKVGDIVRGISDRYNMIGKDMTRGEVVSVGVYSITIKVLEHEGRDGRKFIGQSFPALCPECFELVGADAPASPISRTLYNPPATVVFWSDGMKTVAKCAPHERYDREKGLAIACAKKLLGAEYAEAFKEFREPANRVLSIDEVHALRDGTKLYVEIKPSVFSGEGVHWKSGSKLIAQNGCFWPIDKASEDVGRTAKWARVWLLPRKPTADELAANPWPKREG